MWLVGYDRRPKALLPPIASKKTDCPPNRMLMTKKKTHSISFTDAYRLLLSVEAGQHHAAPIGSELGAIITHWLQCPTKYPMILGDDAAKRWRSALATYARSSDPILIDFPTVAQKSPFVIEQNGIPFPALKKTHFSFVDLFAGIGGFRIALQQLGGKCLFSSEWEPHAKETYLQNFGEIPFGDIKKFTAVNASGDATVHSIPKHDILAAGFPCQAFSQAGKQLGFNEARGTLFFEILKIAKVQKPRVLLLENVKRLKTHDQGRTFMVIVNSLRELGYKVYAKVLRAHDYGLLQNRERIFIVAFDKPIQFKFPGPPSQAKSLCVADILETDVPDSYTITDRIFAGHKRRLKEHRAKGNGFGFSIFKPEATSTNTISARYWKDGSEVLIDQGKINPRMLTPRECARLQGFPDSFIPNQVRRHAYQQFGNSVPVPVVNHVALEILHSLKNNLKVRSMTDPYEPVIE